MAPEMRMFESQCNGPRYLLKVMDPDLKGKKDPRKGDEADPTEFTQLTNYKNSS